MKNELSKYCYGTCSSGQGPRGPPGPPGQPGKLLVILCIKYYNVHFSPMMPFPLSRLRKTRPERRQRRPRLLIQLWYSPKRTLFCLPMYVSLRYIVILLLFVQEDFQQGHLGHRDLLDQKAQQVTRCSKELIYRSF